jgi:hypothetical protein
MARPPATGMHNPLSSAPESVSDANFAPDSETDADAGSDSESADAVQFEMRRMLSPSALIRITCPWGRAQRWEGRTLAPSFQACSRFMLATSGFTGWASKRRIFDWAPAMAIKSSNSLRPRLRSVQPGTH